MKSDSAGVIEKDFLEKLKAELHALDSADKDEKRNVIQKIVGFLSGNEMTAAANLIQVVSPLFTTVLPAIFARG